MKIALKETVEEEVYFFFQIEWRQYHHRDAQWSLFLSFLGYIVTQTISSCVAAPRVQSAQTESRSAPNDQRSLGDLLTGGSGMGFEYSDENASGNMAVGCSTPPQADS